MLRSDKNYYADKNKDSEKTSTSGKVIEAVSPYRAPTPAEAEKYVQETNLPALYITLDNDVNINQITHDTYIPGTCSLIYEGEGIFDQSIEIKGRGNYSWSFPQKPYNLKFTEKTDLLGMGSARTWVLITTYSDKTLLRNYLTLSLAYDIGMQYSPEVNYVDVYVNGKYNGLYVLSEKIQLNKNRINVDEKIGGLFEIEATYRHGNGNNCPYCITVPSGVHIIYKEGKEEDLGAELKTEMLENFTELFVNADLAMKEGYDEFSKYIDVPSFIDWYIVNEFVKNFDSGFTTSCYCYVKGDGKIYMGPCWDYDTCMGNQEVATCILPTGYHVRTSAWYTMLNDDPVFEQMLNERWTELRNEGVFDKFLDDIYAIPKYIAQSEEMTHKLYKNALKSRDLRGGKSLFTYEEEVEYLHNWISKRITWLDKQWKIDEE